MRFTIGVAVLLAGCGDKDAQAPLPPAGGANQVIEGHASTETDGD